MAQIKRLQYLWTYVVTDSETGEEALLADQRNGALTVFVTMSEAALGLLRPAALAAAHELNAELSVVRFKREDSNAEEK